MTPTEPPREEPAAPLDPIRMALGALVASCFAGYKRARQGASGPVDGTDAVPATDRAQDGRPSTGTGPTR